MDLSIVTAYRGRWVGVDSSGNVVADADEVDKLLDALDAAQIVGATVWRVPALDELLFVGLR
jgi:hypothetical protein